VVEKWWKSGGKWWKGVKNYMQYQCYKTNSKWWKNGGKMVENGGK
jgi:hypothetical protein